MYVTTVLLCLSCGALQSTHHGPWHDSGPSLAASSMITAAATEENWVGGGCNEFLLAMGSELARLRGTKTDIIAGFSCLSCFDGVCDG